MNDEPRDVSAIVASIQDRITASSDVTPALLEELRTKANLLEIGFRQYTLNGRRSVPA